MRLFVFHGHFILSLKSSIDGPTTVSRLANHFLLLFLVFRFSLPDGPITGWPVLQSFSANIQAKMWNGRFFVLSRLISWTSYSMCDNADKRKKTNIVPNSNSLFLGFFQLKYMFWRQRIKVLSLALLTLRLSIFYNPRYINDPAKSKTDSWANV